MAYRQEKEIEMDMKEGDTTLRYQRHAARPFPPTIQRRPSINIYGDKKRELEREIAINRGHSPGRESLVEVRHRSPSRERVSYGPPLPAFTYRPDDSYQDDRYYDSHKSRSLNRTTQPLLPQSIVINNRITISASSSGESQNEDDVSNHGQRKHRRRGHRSHRRRAHKDDRNRTQETREVTRTQNATSAREVLLKRGVNGVWDTSQKSDMTIHLKLGLQEDLDEPLEEFCRLQRFGDFESARKLFNRNLKDVQDNPCVLVQYAEMLLDQGDYNTMAELRNHPTFNTSNQDLDNDAGRFLTVYWKLLHLENARHRTGVECKEFDIIPEALDRLHAMVSSNDANIGSTEIKMLALLLRMQDSSMHIYMQTEWLKTQLDKLFPPSFYSSLFAMLLRQGRVWDFRDIFTARLLADGDETIYLVHDVSGSHRPLQALLAIWETSSVDDQCLTALALLDILLAVSMDQKSYPEKFRIITEDAGAMATQLALSIIEKDPAAMKSRTFIRWMIDRVHDAIAEDQEEADNAVKHLRSQPGILIEFFHLALPNYIPVKSENPGWRLENAPSKYSGPVKAVLKTARKLGDYSMEAEALEGLTWLSKNPSKEFDELCTLLKVRQGDFKSYAHAMVFKYLISTTEAQKKQFRDELRELCFEPGLADCLSAHDIWTISMLLYSIEDEGGEAEKALNIALNSSRYISADLIEKLETKMPDMRSKRSRYIDQTSGSLTDRKEAELGINMVERERRDRNVVSFPDIAADRLVQKDTEPTVTKEVVDLNPPARVHTTRESLREESNRRNISCSDLDLWQLHSDEPRRHRRRKERSRERRLARDQDYRLERLEQLRKEIEALKLMQQISRETERAKGEPEDIRKTRGPGELEGLAVRKPETAMRHKEETAHEEVWRRERAERDAIEYYKREVSEKESREKQERVLLEQLRELRNEVQELRSEVKSERSDRHFHVEGQPPIPERLRRGSFFRYTRRRNPPRTIQVDHPSSTDAEHSNDGRLIEIDGHSSSRDNRPDSVTSDDDVRSLAAYVEEVDDDHETPSGRTRRVEMIRVDPQSEGETSTGSKGKNKSARNGFSGQEIVVHGLESTMIERRTALRPEHETEHNTFEGDHVGSPGKRLQLAHDAGSETNADDEAPSSASTTLIT